MFGAMVEFDKSQAILRGTKGLRTSGIEEELGNHRRTKKTEFVSQPVPYLTLASPSRE